MEIHQYTYDEAIDRLEPFVDTKYFDLEVEEVLKRVLPEYVEKIKTYARANGWVEKRVEIVEELKTKLRDIGETKYARVVIEIEIPKDSTTDDVEDLIKHEIEKLSKAMITIDDIEICDMPYELEGERYG